MRYSDHIKGYAGHLAHLICYALWGIVALKFPVWSAAPTFENATPVGFAVHDSTTQSDFVVGDTIRVRADLNQAVNASYPVTGHFHALEQSDQVGTTATDGMQVDVAIELVAPFGAQRSSPAIHMAWIEEVGVSAGLVYNGGITPVYQVKYARSVDGGANC